MPDLDINFDGVEAPAPASDVVPPGSYKAEVVNSDYGPTKKGGKMMTLEWCILEGPYKNRRVWDRQNLENASPDTQKYARQALVGMSAAMGMTPPNKTELLHNKPVMIKVAVQEGKGDYGPNNTVKGYTKVEGSRASTATPSFAGGGRTSAAPVQAADTPAQPATTASAPSPTRPWLTQKAG